MKGHSKYDRHYPRDKPEEVQLIARRHVFDLSVNQMLDPNGGAS